MTWMGIYSLMEWRDDVAGEDWGKTEAIQRTIDKYFYRLPIDEQTKLIRYARQNYRMISDFD